MKLLKRLVEIAFGIKPGTWSPGVWTRDDSFGPYCNWHNDI